MMRRIRQHPAARACALLVALTAACALAELAADASTNYFIDSLDQGRAPLEDTMSTTIYTAPRAAACSTCNDTGDTGTGHLDCTDCGAAADRAALAKWARANGHGNITPSTWAIFQHGRAGAPTSTSVAILAAVQAMNCACDLADHAAQVAP